MTERPKRGFRTGSIAILVAVGALAVPTFVYGHVERASYWPDPAPDKSVKPATGGKIPERRSLYTALKKSKPGETRVVCQGGSLSRLRAAIKDARANGRTWRPSEPAKPFSHARRVKLREFNKRLKRHCDYDSIQDAVNDSGNNDRVVIMPGVYTEPESRAAPTNDPACDDLKETNDKGNTGAVSYSYQVHCPNDQNLIAVIGREESGRAPQPPLEDRRGIPDLGPCIRCNLQIEGSGVAADDVVIDAGDTSDGNGGPAEGDKDVGIRADRADGFVLTKVTVRHVNEHAIYVLESDGYLLDRFKAFYAGEYGVLTFVEDHGLMQKCDAAGHGDSALYPGAGAEGGDQRSAGEPVHYTQEIRSCDMHHSAGGYSGTDGNSTWVHDNDFYDNALGFTTDVFTAAGHPGFPQDSDLIEDNEFYSNNFNVYDESSDVKPVVPFPVGTGLWIAGGNHNIVRNNRFWDNWRRGTMLFAVPDATVCGPAIGSPVTGCDPAKFSTSYNNEFYGNVMGVAPDGSSMPNGVDFWWDSFPGNTGNCWHDNGTVTSSPPAPLLPDCKTLPSIGIGYLPNELELLGCFAALSGGGFDSTACPWFESPSQPGTSAAAADQRAARANAEQKLEDPQVLDQVCDLFGKRRDDVAACKKS